MAQWSKFIGAPSRNEFWEPQEGVAEPCNTKRTIKKQLSFIPYAEQGDAREIKKVLTIVKAIRLSLERVCHCSERSGNKASARFWLLFWHCHRSTTCGG